MNAELHAIVKEAVTEALSGHPGKVEVGGPDPSQGFFMNPSTETVLPHISLMSIQSHLVIVQQMP